MKIYAAISDHRVLDRFFKQFPDKHLNVLISYVYLSGNIDKIEEWKKKKKIKSLILDSGVYSAMNGKSKIEMLEYYHYVKNFGRIFDYVINFDIYTDTPDLNEDNQLYLEDNLGLELENGQWEQKNSDGIKSPPIPVVHEVTKAFDEFKKYVDFGHRYIAVGSTVSRDNKKMFREEWEKITELANEKNVKIHLLGKNGFKNLMEFRGAYSVDGAQFIHDAKTGLITVLAKNDKKSSKLDKKNHKIYVGNRDPKMKITYDAFKKNIQEKIGFDIDKYLKKFGFEYKDLINDPFKRMVVNLYNLFEVENYINDLPDGANT